MKNHKIFLWLGIIIFVLPFLGIRQSYKNTILFIAGLLLITIAIIVRNQVRAAQYGSSERVFVENKNESQAVSYEDAPVAVNTEETPADIEPTYASDTMEQEAMVPYGDVHDLVTDATVAVPAVEETLKPIKKPRKKRITKKPTIREEMNEPIVISEEVTSIMGEIDQTIDVDKE